MKRASDSGDAAYNRTFAYDDLNRLMTANSGASLWGNGSYTYDAMGNMLTMSLGTSRSEAFTYSGTTPKIATVTENGAPAVSVSYDAAGNAGTSGTVTVFITSGDRTPPVVQINSPASETTLSASVSVTSKSFTSSCQPSFPCISAMTTSTLAQTRPVDRRSSVEAAVCFWDIRS